MAQNYNDTIHKMQTPFEMRAGLPKKEPKMLEDWEQNHVYISATISPVFCVRYPTRIMANCTPEAAT